MNIVMELQCNPFLLLFYMHNGKVLFSSAMCFHINSFVTVCHVCYYLLVMFSAVAGCGCCAVFFCFFFCISVVSLLLCGNKAE